MTQVKNGLRQAITTKYHGPTDTRGSRISASCEAGRVSVPYDHSLNTDGNHDAAVSALLNKLGWGGNWIGGGMAGSGYCYVDTSESWDEMIPAPYNEPPRVDDRHLLDGVEEVR